MAVIVVVIALKMQTQWKQSILDDDNVRVERTVIIEKCFSIVINEEENDLGTNKCHLFQIKFKVRL